MKKNRKTTILLVDDNIKNIYSLEQLLKAPDRELLHVTTGNQALKTVLNREIDMLILDVQMPGMDGFEVAQILKTNKRTRDIPIIFVSAERKEHEFMMKGFEEGGVDYLFKPLDPDLTRAKVSVLLRLHLQYKELLEKNHILEKYNLLIDNSADTICILNEKTLKFEEVNQAFGSLLGINPNDIRGTTLLKYLVSEERKRVQNLIENEKKAEFSFETCILGKGREIRWLNWNIVKKYGLLFANARDITEMREVEEIRKYLSIVVKQSHDAIYMYNLEGKIISWNLGAELIYGFTEAEALNMNIWNIVPEHLMKETQEIIDRLIHDKEVKARETKRTTKFGKIIDVMFSASIITNQSGEVVSVAITEKDITEQKGAENEIRQLNTNLKNNLAELELANKELESFSYSISHDLKTPLFFIKNEIKMIMDEYSDTFDIKLSKIVGNIGKNVNNAIELIEDLLKFCKSGKNDLNMDYTDLTELVSRVLEQTKSHYDKSIVTVERLEPAYCDQTLIFQVFSNLISNGLKYSRKKKKPKLWIGSRVCEDEVIYHVKDNGDGFHMNDQNLEMLFEPFKRLHSNEEFKGTGVGLAIVKRIVTRHGGRVWAESQKGEGATFFFTLPAVSVSEMKTKSLARISR